MPFLRLGIKAQLKKSLKRPIIAITSPSKLYFGDAPRHGLDYLRIKWYESYWARFFVNVVGFAYLDHFITVYVKYVHGGPILVVDLLCTIIVQASQHTWVCTSITSNAPKSYARDFRASASWWSLHSIALSIRCFFGRAPWDLWVGPFHWWLINTFTLLALFCPPPPLGSLVHAQISVGSCGCVPCHKQLQCHVLNCTLAILGALIAWVNKTFPARADSSWQTSYMNQTKLRRKIRVKERW